MAELREEWKSKFSNWGNEEKDRNFENERVRKDCERKIGVWCLVADSFKASS